MNENFKPVSESSDPEKIEVSSQKGIRFRAGDRSFLDIPIALVKQLVVDGKLERDAINKLHEEVFDGSGIMWGQTGDDFYTIELGHQATEEQVQALINKIEGVSDKSQKEQY